MKYKRFLFLTTGLDLKAILEEGYQKSDSQRNKWKPTNRVVYTNQGDITVTDQTGMYIALPTIL